MAEAVGGGPRWGWLGAVKVYWQCPSLTFTACCTRLPHSLHPQCGLSREHNCRLDNYILRFTCWIITDFFRAMLTQPRHDIHPCVCCFCFPSVFLLTMVCEPAQASRRNNCRPTAEKHIALFLLPCQPGVPRSNIQKRHRHHRAQSILEGC